MNKTISKWLLAATVLGIAVPAQAVDVGLTASIGAGRSDNIARTSANEVDEDILTGGLQLSLTEQSQNVTADVQARAMRYRYQDDTFDDETLATFIGQLRIASANSPLSWVVQDNYGQQIIDPFRAITPNNRENVNVFSTGPDLRLPLGQQNTVVLSLRYLDTNFEFRPQDNDQRSASVQFTRQSTATRSFSLIVTGDDIRYDDQTVNVDLERLQAFGRIQLNTERTNFSLDLGWTEIDSVLTTSDGVLLALSLTRQTSPFGTLSLSAGRRFSEAGDIFTQFQQVGNRGVGVFGVDATADVTNTSDPFELNYANVGYGVERDRTSFGFGAGWRDEDYEVRNDLNRSITTFDANVARRVTPRFRLQGFAQLRKREFDVNGQSDDDLEYGVVAGWDIGPRTALDLEFNRLERDSNVAAAEFTENRVFLTLSYRILLSAANR